MPDGLDPNISLQSGRNLPQYGPDVGQIMSLARLGMAIQQQQQQQQTLAALRQAYANPQNFVGGMPTMGAISQAGQASPQAAMELQKFGMEGAKGAYLQQQLQHVKEQMALDHNKEAMGIQDKAQELFETRVNVDKWPVPEARAAAQRFYTDSFDRLFATGAMPESQRRMIPPNFDPAANAQNIARRKQIQDLIASQEKEGLERQKASREGFGEAGDYVGSNTRGQPVFAQLNKDTGRIEEPGGQVVENPKKVSTSSPNPKVQAFDTFMREHPSATAEEQADFIKSTGASGRTGAVQIQRLSGALNEASASIGNMVDLPITATAGLFQGLQNETADSLSGAIHRTIANYLTPQDAADVQVTFTGLQRNLAAVEAQGSAYGLVGLSKQMQALMPKAGQSAITALRQYAEMRQIMERGIQSILANPGIGEKQEKMLQQNLEEIHKAVPYTVKDVNDLERGTKKNWLGHPVVSDESAKEFAEKILKGRQDQGSSAIPTEARAKLQEGQITTFANGQKWTLKNGQPEQVP